MLLEQINQVNDIKKLNKEDWNVWLARIEEFCEKEKVSCYAENAFNKVSNQCLIRPLDVQDRLCAEIDNPEDLKQVSGMLKEVENRTVYMCFSADMLHSGHIAIIRKAARLGRLIIGVLSDEAVISYKRYPLLPYAERKALFENIRGVSRVVEQKTLSYKEFYNEMRKGATPTTSQINSYDFEEEFIKHIKNGDSIIYISLSSNLSGTFNSANIAKNNLIEEYPDAKIYLVDSLSVSVGQGFLVEKACDMRNNGLNAEEIVNWLEENKRKVVHSILIDDLNHLKRGGRISSTTATIGGLLNIKPTLYIDDDGKLVQGEKIKGKKKALRFLVNEVKERAINTENETLYICHGDCLEEAETLKNMILEEVKFKNIVINYIGNVVGAHAGPGVLAALFLGENR